MRTFAKTLRIMREPEEQIKAVRRFSNTQGFRRVRILIDITIERLKTRIANTQPRLGVFIYKQIVLILLDGVGSNPEKTIFSNPSPIALLSSPTRTGKCQDQIVKFILECARSRPGARPNLGKN